METPAENVRAGTVNTEPASTRMQALQGPDIEPPGDLDRVLHAGLARLTQGLAPASMALAWLDWGMHLAASPGKWLQLFDKAWRKDGRWLEYALHSTFGTACEHCITPLPQDRRFRDPAWQQWPFDLLQQAFLLNQQWWHNATTGIDGVSRHHEDVWSFPRASCSTWSRR